MSTTSAQRDNRTEMISRTTRDGRALTYALTVIQQPERARACGAGAKSSADRRPVDPPPVVELRIFEGLGPDQKDITFCYNANFFLYATLEACRPIAHGRMPGTAQQQPAVLTGMPVSGMAYLDRPQEAGYFIFQDLSVRHEGKYKLSFNLYEETKDENDLDVESAQESRGLPGPGGSFDWRLEIKSAPFTVFSAKKFPGLAESTPLSRTVAEQGCRVRIRRDVRMRRRDGKAEENYDEDEYSRSRRTPSPIDSVHQVYSRQRSLSVDQQSPPYNTDRRVSAAEPYQQQHPQGYAPPPVAQAPPGQFANPSHYQQHAYPPAPMPPQQPRYAPPPQNGQLPSQGYYQQEYRPPQPLIDSYSREQYESQMRERAAYDRQMQDEYYRRNSNAYGGGPPPPPVQQGHNYPPRTEPAAYAPHQQPYPPRTLTPVNQPAVNLAPLKMPPIEPKYDSLSSPAGPLSRGSRMPIASQLPSPAIHNERPNYSSSAPLSAATDPARSGKRPFQQAFSSTSSTYSQPMHNGMRPDDRHFVHAANFDDDEDAVDMEALKMSYKRADGNVQQRELPTLR